MANTTKVNTPKTKATKSKSTKTKDTKVETKTTPKVDTKVETKVTPKADNKVEAVAIPKPVVKEITKADKVTANDGDRTEYVSSWSLKTKLDIGKVKPGGITEVNDKVFPDYCEAAGMPHTQVVKAIKIIKSFSHDFKAITNEVIEEQKKEIGLSKVSVRVPITGTSDGRGGTAKLIIEHMEDGVNVMTKDGNKTTNLNTTLNTIHLGSSKMGFLSTDKRK